MTQTEIDNCISMSNGVCKYSAHFKYHTMPKINGILCHSIWAPHDFINSMDICEDPLFYDKWTYTPNYHGDERQQNVLTDDIKKLFGYQMINGKQQFVRHLSFRLDSSGHADPDNIATIYVKDHIISVYNIAGATWYGDHSIYYMDPYFVKVCETLLNKKFDVKHYNIPNPGITDVSKERSLYEACLLKDISCALQYVDGIIYPDAQLPTWRRGFPYISNSKDNKDNIRIWDETANRHLYLTRITNEKYPDYSGSVMYVDFSKDSWSAASDGFCKIQQKYTDNNRTDLCFITTEIDNSNRSMLMKDSWEFGGHYMIQRICHSYVK